MAWQRMLCAATSPTIPICGSLKRARCHGSTRDAIPLREQLLNHLIGLLVGSFSEVPVADEAVGIYQIPRRPETLVVRVPDSVIVVQHYWILDVLPRDGFAHVGDVLLETELRRVNPDDEQAVVPVLFIQCVDVRLGILAVETAIRPELDQHHLLARGILYRETIRVDEACRACDLFSPRILIFFARDPLRVEDFRSLLRACVTFYGLGSLGIIGRAGLDLLHVARSILPALGLLIDPSSVRRLLFDVRPCARRVCARSVEPELDKDD